MLPPIIPLFPLPDAVLFPRMPLPLHVFEPRYREMVRDALRGSRLIGMVLLRGDWEREYGGRPRIFTTGTVGQMVHVEELPDGRYNVVLRGVKRFVIQQELPPTRAYREALVAWRDDAEEPIAGERPKQRLFGSSAPPQASLHSKVYVIDRSVVVGAWTGGIATNCAP